MMMIAVDSISYLVVVVSPVSLWSCDGFLSVREMSRPTDDTHEKSLAVIVVFVVRLLNFIDGLVILAHLLRTLA